MQNRVIHLFVMLLFVACSEVAQTKHAKGGTNPQTTIDTITTYLTQNQVGKIEIVQIPAAVLTRSRITPEMLERQFHNKLVIRDVVSSVHRTELSKVLKSLSAQSRTESADLRWGVIFYLRNESRIGALYFNANGSRGAVGTEPVSFKGDFFDWLDSTFSRCLR
jgi:hypothetical protein